GSPVVGTMPRRRGTAHGVGARYSCRAAMSRLMTPAPATAGPLILGKTERLRTRRRHTSYLSNERFLRAQDAELVPLGVGEHGPRLRAALPDIDPACAERENPPGLS